MTARFNRNHFDALPIVGILRACSREAVEQMVPAVFRGGLRNVEITMNTEGAASLIERCCTLAAGQANVGAGTVTDLGRLQTALDAGASFIVTPIVCHDVIRACIEKGIPVMPGALSPAEVVTAWQFGALCVKIFPADKLGPGYIKALAAPLPHIPLMPTGGVTVESLPVFRKAGAAAYGVGTPLFDPTQVAAANWPWFEEQARRFSEAFRSK